MPSPALVEATVARATRISYTYCLFASSGGAHQCDDLLKGRFTRGPADAVVNATRRDRLAEPRHGPATEFDRELNLVS